MKDLKQLQRFLSFPYEYPILSKSELENILDRTSKETKILWGIPNREYYLRPAEEVAKDMIGCLLLNVVQIDNDKMSLYGGRIVEAEAYLGEVDPACHASRGITQITQIFYREGGIAYVFHAYGIYHCLNVITGSAGFAGCVLIRAIEPTFGLEEMAKRRKVSLDKPQNLCSGPGRLCQALAIDSKHNGWNLRNSPLLILVPEFKEISISQGPRIGISKAADLPLRFWAKDSLWISRR